MKPLWRTINSPIIVTLIFGLYFYFCFYHPLHPARHTSTSRTTYIQNDAYSTMYSYFDGKKYASVVSAGALNKTPAIDPDLKNVSLTPSEVLARAKGMLSKLVPDPSIFKSEAISLEKQDRIGHYVYVVRFASASGPDASVFLIVVLLDGTVIQPKITSGDD